MKQSSIEWLIDMIEYTSKDTYYVMLESGFLEKAKEMHKQEVITAREDGFISALKMENTKQLKTNKQYYNETYNIKS